MAILGKLKYSYKYDQLNRLTVMDVYQGMNNATNVFTPVGINDYNERVPLLAYANKEVHCCKGFVRQVFWLDNTCDYRSTLAEAISGFLPA